MYQLIRVYKNGLAWGFGVENMLYGRVVFESMDMQKCIAARRDLNEGIAKEDDYK